MNDKKMLSANVAEEITQMIISGQFPQGCRIPNEQTFADMFNVSRGTVREAIKILVSAGILEIRRGNGTFVRSLTGISEDPFGLRFVAQDSLMTELEELRYLIEPQVAALATERATDEEIAEMAVILASLEEISQRFHATDDSCDDTLKLAAEKDVAFHNMLYKMCHNSALERLIPVISQPLINSFTRDSFKGFYKSMVNCSTHRLIYTLLVNRNAEEIAIVTRRHLQCSLSTARHELSQAQAAASKVTESSNCSYTKSEK
ncbi:MAG: FadR/GntR family transcriptional regulator [Clostridia bacterium]